MEKPVGYIVSDEEQDKEEDIPQFEGAITFQGNFETMEEFMNRNSEDDKSAKDSTNDESSIKSNSEEDTDVCLYLNSHR